MTETQLTDPDYRHAFHGHETFPLRYGWLQKAYDAVALAETERDTIHVFNDPASIARFGLGRNMVKSLRYWAVGAGVIEASGKGLSPSWLGDALFGPSQADPFLEDPDALWLLHWHLTSRPNRTSWHWLFNGFNAGDFSRAQLVDTMLAIATRNNWSRVSRTTVDRDFQCLLRTYVGGRGDTDSQDSVLAELGLIRPLGGGRFRLERSIKPSLGSAVFLYALVDYWTRRQPAAATLSFDAIGYEPGSPGRVFALNHSALTDRLEGLEEYSNGHLVWSETAGLRQVVLRGELDLKAQQAKVIKALTARGWELAA